MPLAVFAAEPEPPDAIGAYADCAIAADRVSGFPQSWQYRASASFSCPQKLQVVLAAGFAGAEKDEGGGEPGVVTPASRGGKTAWAANIGRQKWGVNERKGHNVL